MDALKRQADADAIRHAAKLIEAVTFEPRTEAGSRCLDLLKQHQDHIYNWMSERADSIERGQP